MGNYYFWKLLVFNLSGEGNTLPIDVDDVMMAAVIFSLFLLDDFMLLLLIC